MKKNFSFPFILFKTFSAIGSPDLASSNTHPRYVACECCFIFTCLYLIFTRLTFFNLCLLAKRTDLIFSLSKCILSLLSYPQNSDRYFQSLYQAVFGFYLLFCGGARCMNHLHIKVKLI